MTIDVSSILKEFGGKIEVCGEVEVGELEFYGQVYTFKDPLKVKGVISNNGKTLVLTADVEALMGTQCARCLDDIEVDAGFSMEEHFVRSEDNVVHDDETIVFEGYTIDVDEAVIDDLVMNIDGRYLCSEDCKGLCPQCGKNLNEGECDCNNEYVDPRWAGLADLIDKD
jgi:uncharacterized protein